MSVPKAFPPAEFVRDEMVERGWLISELAEAIGWPINDTTHLVGGYMRVTATVAERIGRAFGTSGALWLNLQKQYDKENQNDTHRR